MVGRSALQRLRPERWRSWTVSFRLELASQFDTGTVLDRQPGAVLYLAHDFHTQRQVVLRVIARRRLQQCGIERSFERALAAAALEHPHIVPIQRFGTTASLVWYAMRYVEGQTLAEKLQGRATLDPRVCQRVAEQVAGALQFAHRRGVTHGEISPATILISADGSAFIKDLAITRVLARLWPDESPAEERSAYQAPEDLSDGPATPAMDQYALAAVIFHCMTGAAGRNGNGSDGQNGHAQSGRPAPKQLPGYLSAALSRAMSPVPADRYPSVLELAWAMRGPNPEQVQKAKPRGQPPSREGQPVLFVANRPQSVSWLGIGAVLFFGAVIVGLWLLRAKPQLPPAPPPEVTLRREPQIAPPPPEPIDSLPSIEDSRPTPPAPTARVSKPAAAPAKPVTRSVTPATAPAASPAVTSYPPGRLFVNSLPWGRVFVDGQLLGNTPLADFPVSAGAHSLTVVREGFRPFERQIYLSPNDKLRLTDIVLQGSNP